MSAESQLAANHAAQGGAVFRHRGMVALFAIGTVLLLLLYSLTWTQPNVGNVVGSTVAAVFLWFVWAVGWWTKVVVSADGVMIDNVFVSYMIPWRIFNNFSVDGGLIATLSDGTRLGVVSFGGSLAAALTGYRGMSRTRDAMKAACNRYRTEDHGAWGRYQRRVEAHLLGLAGYLVLLDGITIGIDITRHVL